MKNKKKITYIVINKNSPYHKVDKTCRILGEKTMGT